MTDPTRTVTTQAEFDQAVVDEIRIIKIASPAGVWITVHASDSSTVRAFGSATVRASGLATVHAFDSSMVHAYDSSTVRAFGSSMVHAFGSATVHATDSSTVHTYGSAYGSPMVHAFGSATVRASGLATVHAYDSSTVRAFGSATVHASDSSTVTATDSSMVHAFGSATVHTYGSATVTATDSSMVHAYDSSMVHAYDSSTVRATDSSTVHATDSSTVTAASRVAVHLHSGQARVDGGVLIDHTPEPKNAEEWCAWHDVAVEDGVATLYKAVNDQWTTGRGVDYSPGFTPEAPDWSPDGECGGGLHFSPTPAQAQSYYAGATRYVAVGVLVEELSPILGGIPKAKARRVVVPCREVDIDMKEIIHD